MRGGDLGRGDEGERGTWVGGGDEGEREGPG